MILAVVFLLASRLDKTYSVRPDHHFPDTADFMNIEVGSKYNVGNDMADIVDDNSRIITFDDLIIGHVDPMKNSGNRFKKDLNNHENKTIQKWISSVKTNNSSDNNADKNALFIGDGTAKSEDNIVNENENFGGINDIRKVSSVPVAEIIKEQYANENYENKSIKRISQRSNIHKGFQYETQKVIVEHDHEKPLNKPSSQFENSKMDLNTADPIKQIKLAVLNSLKHYSNRIAVNTTLLKMDNFQVKLLKGSNILTNEDVLNERNLTDDELDKLLVGNLLKTIQSHQINIGFSNDGNGKDGLLNQFVTFEGKIFLFNKVGT